MATKKQPRRKGAPTKKLTFEIKGTYRPQVLLTMAHRILISCVMYEISYFGKKDGATLDKKYAYFIALLEELAEKHEEAMKLLSLESMSKTLSMLEKAGLAEERSSLVDVLKGWGLLAQSSDTARKRFSRGTEAKLKGSQPATPLINADSDLRFATGMQGLARKGGAYDRATQMLNVFFEPQKVVEAFNAVELSRLAAAALKKDGPSLLRALLRRGQKKSKSSALSERELIKSMKKSRAKK